MHYMLTLRWCQVVRRGDSCGYSRSSDVRISFLLFHGSFFYGPIRSQHFYASRVLAGEQTDLCLPKWRSFLTGVLAGRNNLYARIASVLIVS